MFYVSNGGTPLPRDITVIDVRGTPPPPTVAVALQYCRGPTHCPRAYPAEFVLLVPEAKPTTHGG